jgi:hypothetical protein
LRKEGSIARITTCSVAVSSVDGFLVRERERRGGNEGGACTDMKEVEVALEILERGADGVRPRASTMADAAARSGQPPGRRPLMTTCPLGVR